VPRQRSGIDIHLFIYTHTEDKTLTNQPTSKQTQNKFLPLPPLGSYAQLSPSTDRSATRLI